MMRKVMGLLLPACILLSACGTPSVERSTASSTVEAPMLAPAPPAPAGAAAPPSTPAAPVLGFRPAPPQLVLVPMPTGAVLLREGNREINHQFCLSFFSETQSVTRGIEDEKNVVQLFWLVQPSVKTFSPPPDKASLSDWCNRAIAPDVYDYQRATVYLGAIGRGASNGPVLLAMANSDPHRDNMIIDAGKMPADQIPQLVQLWRSAFTKLSQEALTSERIALAIQPKRKRAAGKTFRQLACAPKIATLTEDGYRVTTSITPEHCAPSAPTTLIEKPEDKRPRQRAIDMTPGLLTVDEHPTLHLMCIALEDMLPGAMLLSPYVLFAGEVFDYGYCKGAALDVYRLIHRSSS